MKVFPVYLNRLDSKLSVLIGGDHEAERKAKELLDCDANLTLISPQITDELKNLAEKEELTWIPREYKEGDLNGAFLVIVAEFKGDTNERVFREAEERGILVNVMDDIPHCTFTFGSLIKRGPLTLSVSTSGAAPTLAVRLRQRFEREFGREYEPFLDFMQELRSPMAVFYPDFRTRKSLWYRLIDSDILEHFRQDRTDLAVRRAEEIVGSDVVKETSLFTET
ncbi:MAG: bifunctional precorrin-2 dehydrogenase/sirohydrochlorin ferrochelatase [Balneolaceae bacterium]